mmetsp:Transcript_29141/g.32357  ORF Transcript_29141/g.32357 Transcript_29141/m.32357 type:complete len:224 (-) Transcript_29141:23-694(-)
MMNLNDLDMESINKRIILNEDQLTFCLTKYAGMIKGIAESDMELASKSYNGTKASLEELLFQLNKTDPIVNALVSDASHYEDKCTQKQNAIRKLKQDVIQLRLDLDKSMARRKRKEEYAQLSAIVNKFPKRSDTQKEIDELREELETVERTHNEVTGKVDKRGKQMQLLFYALGMLEDQLLEEKKEEEREARERALQSQRAKIKSDGMDIDKPDVEDAMDVDK